MAAPKRDNIKATRIRRGIKRPTLALMAEISYKHMWGIEEGKHPVSIEVLHRIANALEVDISEVHDAAESPGASTSQAATAADEARHEVAAEEVGAA